ncbi:MAG: polysaccharide biosynthesis protein [Balneolaceae bacterium]|nr:MAG: polysaccharide biosynthesis protein [Balneolaceae bacterium]
MADKSSNLTEKTGVVVFARIVTTFIDLAIVIATIQILSKTDFAIIGYLLMIHEVARNIATLGFPDSVFYYFERVSGSARRGFVMQTTAILGATAIIAGLIVIGISQIAPALLPHWDAESIAQIQYLLPFMALVVLLEVPTWPVTNILLALDRQKDSAWYEMITSLLTLACLVGPLALGFGLETAIYGLTFYAVVRFVGSWIWMRIVLPEGEMADSGITIRQQAHFAIPLGLSSLVNKINRYTDKFVVSILLPAAAYAEYTIGAQEVPIIRVIPFAVGTVLISRYVAFQLEDKREELLALWYKAVEKVSLLVVPLTIASIIIASDLIAIVAESEGTDYRNSVIPFQIFNLIVLLRVTNYGSILQAFGDTKGVFYLSLNLVTANIILSIPLTIYFGIIGTAAGTFIANFYNWLITLRRIGGHMQLPARKVLPFSFYSKVLFIAGITAIPVWYSRVTFIAAENVLTGLLFSLFTYLILFVLTATVIGIITKSDWVKLRDWLSLKFLR